MEKKKKRREPTPSAEIISKPEYALREFVGPMLPSIKPKSNYDQTWKPGGPIPRLPLPRLDPVLPLGSMLWFPCLPSSKLRRDVPKSLMAKSKGSSSSTGVCCVLVRLEPGRWPEPRRASIAEPPLLLPLPIPSL